MTDEEYYVRERLNFWDRICQYAPVAAMMIIVAMVINGVFGEPIDRYLLLKIFGVAFPVSLVMRLVLFARKVKTLEAEYYVKNRKS